MRRPWLQWAAMTLRVPIVLMVALLVGLSAVQQASAPSDAGHAAALKHAPRVPPSSARVAAAASPLTVVASAPPLAGRVAAQSAGALGDGVLSDPFVPPRV
jgi:hypothetical protein